MAGVIRGIITFSKSIWQKLNVIAWIEFELAYFEAAVQYIWYYTVGTPLCECVLSAYACMYVI